MNTEPEVAIGRRKIGSPHPVYIIAEAGINHDGDPDQARALIEAARDAGADAVKFQVFSADRLVSRRARSCAYQRAHDPRATDQHAMLKALELPRATFVELKRTADEAGIDFLATPFGLEELAFLVEALQVPALKIASTDLVNVPLLTAGLASNLSLILSTGASELHEIDRTVARVRAAGALGRLILLHCVSSYPTRLERCRLRRIDLLRRRFSAPAGFSDHTREIDTGLYAVLAGASVVEKHLTLDRGAAGPDHFFSLEPKSFAGYVLGIRRAEVLLGEERAGVCPEEEEVRKLARGTIVAARSISPGERLSAEALAVRRGEDGIDPSQWDTVIGQVASIDVPADTPLSWPMIGGRPPHASPAPRPPDEEC